jgi:branched-chain amino acid transport system substrate-binding protein
LEKKLHELGSITYPAIAYDSYWLASLSLYKNASINFNKNYTMNSFKNLIFDTAKHLDGISGKILLNSAGDRVSENYDFWMINKNDRGYEWEKENVSILNK